VKVGRVGEEVETWLVGMGVGLYVGILTGRLGSSVKLVAEEVAEGCSVGAGVGAELNSSHANSTGGYELFLQTSFLIHS